MSQQNNPKETAVSHRIAGNERQIYRTLGEIHSAVVNAVSFDEAIHQALRIVTERRIADHAAVWCMDGNGRECRPYYWIFPYDLTTVVCRAGTGIAGSACEKQKTEVLYDFQAEASDADRKALAGMNAVSAVCVPFSISDELQGCLEFVRSGESRPFSPDETEMCSIIAMITEIYIREESPLPDIQKERKVILSARNITKSFVSGGERSSVLNGVNLDVFEGEMLCLLGESGCGKSTFLNIMGGLLDADGGSLTFMEKEILKLTEDQLTEYRRRHIGFVFQSYNLMPNLTAKQNLDLIAELAEDPMDSSEALELVGMKEKAGHYPSQLSGGQQQRISIARALVKKPKFIFADEPTAALDYKTSIEVLGVFEKIREMGTTILMVTHNEEITRMADRIVRFRDGRTHEIILNRRPVHAKDLRW